MRLSALWITLVVILLVGSNGITGWLAYEYGKRDTQSAEIKRLERALAAERESRARVEQTLVTVERRRAAQEQALQEALKHDIDTQEWWPLVVPGGVQRFLE